MNIFLMLLGFDDILSSILAALGMSPVQAITIAYNGLMGIASVPITGWMKTKLALLFQSLPFLNKLIAEGEAEAKLLGWIVPIINSIIGLGFVWIGSAVFNLDLFGSDNIGSMFVTSLAINTTMSHIFFEWRKGKKKV